MKYLIVLFIGLVFAFSACQKRVLYPLSDDYVEGEDDTDSGSSKSTKKRRRRRRRSSSGGSSSNTPTTPISGGGSQTQTEAQAKTALESATGTTLNAFGSGCPSNNWNDDDSIDKLTGSLSLFKFTSSNYVFQKPCTGCNTRDQDIIHKIDFSNDTEATIKIKESTQINFFAGSDYKWYLYASTSNEAPKIEFNPSSATGQPSGGFYTLTATYNRNEFFGDRNYNIPASNLRTTGAVIVFAIGKSGECWSVVKNP